MGKVESKGWGKGFARKCWQGKRKVWDQPCSKGQRANDVNSFEACEQHEPHKYDALALERHIPASISLAAAGKSTDKRGKKEKVYPTTQALDALAQRHAGARRPCAATIGERSFGARLERASQSGWTWNGSIGGSARCAPSGAWFRVPHHRVNSESMKDMAPRHKEWNVPVQGLLRRCGGSASAS